MVDRVLRAIRLEPSLYRHVADRNDLTNEAALLVTVIAILSSLGVLISSQFNLVSYVLQILNSLLFGWILWAYIAYFVGTRLYNGRSSPAEMMRVLGYANTPRLLGLLSFIPCIGWLFAFAGWLLSIIAGVIAIRESMEFDTNKAVITSVAGLLVYIIASILIGGIVGAMMAPFGG